MIAEVCGWEPSTDYTLLLIHAAFEADLTVLIHFWFTE